MSAHTLFRVTSIAVALLTIGICKSVAQSNSRQLITTDPIAQYRVLKNAIDLPAEDGRNWPKGEPYNLSTCGATESVLMPWKFFRNSRMSDPPNFDKTTYELVALAGHIYGWEHDLPQLGYPRQIVIPLIASTERKLLQNLGRAGTRDQEIETLAKQINLARARYKLNAPEVVYNNECGGHGVMVDIRIPKDARLFLASDFLLRVCKAQGYEPFDRSTCNHWVQMVDRGSVELGGFYYYFGEWRGKPQYERFNVENLPGSRPPTNRVFDLAKVWQY